MSNRSQIRLDDGFSTTITLENLPTVKLFETEVKPPGYDAGGPIDTTTMRNTAYRTAAPKKLKSLSNMTSTVAYATEALGELWSQIGVNQIITVHFSDHSTIAFYGWIDKFEPGQHKEGAQPTATLTIQPSMRNNQDEEEAPVYTPPADSTGITI